MSRSTKLENYLRLIGWLLAILLLPIAIGLLSLPLLAYTVLPGLASPGAILKTLARPDIQQELASAVVTDVVTHLPDTPIAGQTIRPMMIIESMGTENWQAMIRETLSPQWLEQQIVSVISQLLSRMSGSADGNVTLDTQAIQDVLQGQKGEELAARVLSLIRECTAAEEATLASAGNTTTGAQMASPVICKPTDTQLMTLMTDDLAQTLAQLSEQLKAQLNTLQAKWDPKHLRFDTPVGQLIVQWPAVQFSTPVGSMSYSIPDAIQTDINTAVTDIQSVITSSLQSIDTAAQPAPADLGEAVQGVEQALSQSQTTTVPTANDGNELSTLLKQLAASIDHSVTVNTAAIGKYLGLLCGLFLLVLTVFILFTVRTFRGVGRWWAVVIIVSGAALGHVSVRLADMVHAALQPAQTDTEIDALSLVLKRLSISVVNAMSNNVNTPLLLAGILLVIIGIVLLIGTFVLSRRRPEYR